MKSPVKIAIEKAKGQKLRKDSENNFKKGLTSLDYHQGRSLMRKINKPN